MRTNVRLTTFKFLFLATFFITMVSCNQKANTTVESKNQVLHETLKSEKPDYFLLRPDLEKMYGYTQAVRIGNSVKIGGVISIDEKGNPIGKYDFKQQMKNCYNSIETILKHYNCTFNDVVLENLYTTSMSELQKNAGYRHEIYKGHFPTGSWIGVNELGLPEIMIEIEIEALIPEN